MKEKIILSIQNFNRIEMFIPIFSRKPFSPIKNSGYFPDLAEIQTLIRFHTFTQIVQNLLQKPCKLTILADGNKYNRACKTPHTIIVKYQQLLQYWIHLLGFQDTINLQDYETWVHKTVDIQYSIREEKFNQLYQEISSQFNKFFNPNRILDSLNTIQSISELGNQLCYTFWSIITSVNYTILYQDNYIENCLRNHNVQNFYISYILSLHYETHEAPKTPLFSKEKIGNNNVIQQILYEMRSEAWDAAKRYVAISLVDRQSNILYKANPYAIKLTIHAKPNELRFIDTSREDFTSHAQHCVGGLREYQNTIKVDFKYRIQREANHEQAICVQVPNHEKYNCGLIEMYHNKQPMYYVKTPKLRS